MIIVLFVVGCLASYWGYEHDSNSFCCIGGIVAALSFMFALAMTVNVSQAAALDDRIAMFEAENTRIEMQIADCVERYQTSEQEAVAEVKPENAVMLVSLYPDLKADALIQEQIEVYTENNKQIRALKDEKISYEPTKWWLYFGS